VLQFIKFKCEYVEFIKCYLFITSTEHSDLVLLCLPTFSTIFQLYRAGLSVLLMEETGGPGVNHRPAASHWQTLSHNIEHVALGANRTHNMHEPNTISRFTHFAFEKSVWAHEFHSYFPSILAGSRTTKEYICDIIYSQPCPCGHLYSAVTCIKRSPVTGPVIENFIWIETLF